MTGVTPERETENPVDGWAEGTRERILAEAIEMFTRHGYHRTTLRLLADRLGVTKAAILYHFPAKDRIIHALMEPFVTALEDAIERAAAGPLPAARLTLVSDFLDTYLAHRRLLLMARTDASIFTHEDTYQRFMRMPGRFTEIIVGPDAPLEDKVWALQIMGTLGDSVLLFDDAPAAELRAAILRGTLRLVTGGPPSLMADGPASPPAEWSVRTGSAGAAPGRQPPVPAEAATPGTRGRNVRGGDRRVGRPRVLSGDRLTRAREMYTSGAHNVEDIAAALGVSRATVYRYLN